MCIRRNSINNEPVNFNIKKRISTTLPNSRFSKIHSSQIIWWNYPEICIRVPEIIYFDWNFSKNYFKNILGSESIPGSAGAAIKRLRPCRMERLNRPCRAQWAPDRWKRPNWGCGRRTTRRVRGWEAARGCPSRKAVACPPAERTGPCGSRGPRSPKRKCCPGLDGGATASLSGQSVRISIHKFAYFSLPEAQMSWNTNKII